jgi:aspartokinase
MERRDVCLVEVLGFGRAPGQARGILAKFGKAGVSLTYLSIGRGAAGDKNMSFCVNARDAERWRPLLDEIRAEYGPDRVEAREPALILTLYGPHFLERHSLAAEVFAVVCGGGIDTLAVCSSVNSISLVIAVADRDRTVACLKRRFVWPD